MKASPLMVFEYVGMLGVPVLLMALAVFALVPVTGAARTVLLLLIGAGSWPTARSPSERYTCTAGQSRGGRETHTGEGNGKTFELVVKRLDAETRLFVEKSFQVEADQFTSVLDLLVSVKEKQDATLSMRYSCNMGICGSCGMVINGKPRLACETNVFSLDSATVRVGPMEAHPVLRDLVTDFDEFFDKHRSVKPWLVRGDQEEKYRAEKEYPQTRDQVDNFLDFSQCIKCGLCVDACPVSNTNPHFVGPQASGPGVSLQQRQPRPGREGEAGFAGHAGRRVGLRVCRCVLRGLSKGRGSGPDHPAAEARCHEETVHGKGQSRQACPVRR